MCTGGIFDDALPTVATVAGGATSSMLDIAINNRASLMTRSQLIISLTAVQLHTGQNAP